MGKPTPPDVIEKVKQMNEAGATRGEIRKALHVSSETIAKLCGKVDIAERARRANANRKPKAPVEIAPEKVAAIRAAREAGQTYRQIAADLGIGRNTIAKVAGDIKPVMFTGAVAARVRDCFDLDNEPSLRIEDLPEPPEEIDNYSFRRHGFLPPAAKSTAGPERRHLIRTEPLPFIDDEVMARCRAEMFGESS